MLLYKYFSRLLLRFVLQLSVKGFQNFRNLCFPENPENIYIDTYTAKQGEAFYFIFSRGAFRTLSNV